MSENITVDSQQASEILGQIQRVQEAARKSFASSHASSILMLWGCVWFFAFLSCYYFPHYHGWIWLSGNIIGIVGMALIFMLGKKTVRAKNIVSKKLGWRIFWFWFLLFIYGDVFLTLLWTERGFKGSQIAAFVCALVMFAYVVMGLLMDIKFMLWLGLVVTALIVIGYLFVHGLFDLWMAPAGGGTLFLTGLYIRLKWKAL